MKNPVPVKDRIVVLKDDEETSNEKESSNKKLVIDGRIAMVTNN